MSNSDDMEYPEGYKTTFFINPIIRYSPADYLTQLRCSNSTYHMYQAVLCPALSHASDTYLRFLEKAAQYEPLEGVAPATNFQRVQFAKKIAQNTRALITKHNKAHSEELYLREKESFQCQVKEGMRLREWTESDEEDVKKFCRKQSRESGMSYTYVYDSDSDSNIDSDDENGNSSETGENSYSEIEQGYPPHTQAPVIVSSARNSVPDMIAPLPRQSIEDKVQRFQQDLSQVIISVKKLLRDCAVINAKAEAEKKRSLRHLPEELRKLTLIRIINTYVQLHFQGMDSQKQKAHKLQVPIILENLGSPSSPSKGSGASEVRFAGPAVLALLIENGEMIEQIRQNLIHGVTYGDALRVKLNNPSILSHTELRQQWWGSCGSGQVCKQSFVTTPTSQAVQIAKENDAWEEIFDEIVEKAMTFYKHSRQDYDDVNFSDRDKADKDEVGRSMRGRGFRFLSGGTGRYSRA
ncbi:hypothetical protein BP6252_02246 [Coleophoma cylindrospora]|uniref:Uncharacterized protein n=1 Tax=Coleophoma cylindrospora TaxID=1849047 RepID=A0A3D8SE93_9HELO|nr:hypothetical protein BP6252_02246 [Coleophoma cylindrospora]